MNSTNQQNIIRVNGPIANFKKVIAKTCHACNSIYLKEGRCELCGYVLDKNIVGDTIGINSLYTIRENYWNSFTFVGIRFEFFERFRTKRKKRYHRNLLWRYRLLLEYFFVKTESDKKRRKIFMLELKDLIDELFLEGISEKVLYSFVSGRENYVFYNTVCQFISLSNKKYILSQLEDTKYRRKAFILMGFFLLLIFIPFILLYIIKLSI